MTPTVPASHSAPAVSRPAQRHAVIDVGTNSVKLLVADISNGIVEPILESSEQTRLGRGFYQTRRLQPDAIRHTATAVAGFAARAREHHVHSLRVFATSAARDASNTDELTRALEHESTVPLEILTGDQEADWVFQGVSTDPKLAGRPLLILDVGGGSTEFILGQGHEKHYRNSFNLGTVRLLEAFPHSDPPTAAERQHLRAWLEDFMQREVRPALLTPLRRESARQPVQLVGTGGTSTILARIAAGLDSFDRSRIEAVQISRTQVRECADHLWSLSLEARKKITGLPPKRADIILAGVLIYESIMQAFDFPSLRVSTRGLRFAAVLDSAQRHQTAPPSEAR